MITSTLFGRVTEKSGELIDYNLTLEYYIISEPLCEEYSDMMRYGIKIKMTAEFTDGTTDEEIKEIRDIFYRRKDAESFIKLLLENKVTPTHLREIIEEYISDTLKLFSKSQI